MPSEFDLASVRIKINLYLILDEVVLCHMSDMAPFRIEINLYFFFLKNSKFRNIISCIGHRLFGLV